MNRPKMASIDPEPMDPQYLRYYRIERVQMKISGLVIAVGAVATVEGCIWLWSISPWIAIAPVVGYGFLLGLLIVLVLGMALGSFVLGDSGYRPERTSDPSLEKPVWTLAAIIFFCGALGRIFEATTDGEFPVTGPELSGWTIWGMVLVITIHWASLLWSQFRTGKLRVEIRKVSTTRPVWVEIGQVAGLVATLCTVFVLNIHPLELLWLLPTLGIVGPVVFVFGGHLLPKVD